MHPGKVGHVVIDERAAGNVFQGAIKKSCPKNGTIKSEMLIRNATGDYADAAGSAGSFVVTIKPLQKWYKKWVPKQRPLLRTLLEELRDANAQAIQDAGRTSSSSGPSVVGGAMAPKTWAVFGSGSRTTTTDTPAPRYSATFSRISGQASFTERTSKISSGTSGP
jgi:hypothetical protein